MEGVQAVADEVYKLIEKEPQRAARLCEIFIAACHEKIEEIDDSSGSFGMLVSDLFCGWIKARQVGRYDPLGTAKAMLFWMENDPYGFCYDIDRAIVKVLDRKGLAAFVREIRTRFESASISNGGKAPSSDYAYRRWGSVLKTLLAGQRDADAYIALCKQTGLGAKDCKTIAEIYQSRRHPEEALSWIERGLAVARTDRQSDVGEYELRGMKRVLLARLGRPDEALQSAWLEFETYPTLLTYKELMGYVPAKDKMNWHRKAMAASERGDLSCQIELWLAKKEIDRLSVRLRKATNEELENLSHYRSEPLARKLARSHPDLAAKVYRALCMRIVKAGKSKYYDEALDNIECARKCYAKAGLEAEWQALVVEVREKHFRKKGFMPGFEDIVSGKPLSAVPPFLERAKARWPEDLSKF